jgi:branched-chain amino acid transport system substrate-binding protein
MIIKTLLTVMLLSVCLIAAEAQTPIRIGISAPLSGPIAEYGNAIVNGVNLAQEEFGNKANIEVFFQDNQYEAKAAISAFNNLKDKKVDVIYMWGSVPASTLADTADRTKTPMITATGYPQSVANRKFIFNYGPGPEKYINVLLRNEKIANAKNVAIVCNDTPYTQGLREAFRSQLRPNTKIVLDETTDHGTLDYRALALRLKKSGADTLGLMLLEPDITNFCRLMRENKFLPIVFGTDQFETRSVVTKCAPVLDSAIYANHTQTKEFTDRYIAKFGNDIQLPDASVGYAIIEILSKVLAEKKTPEEVIAAMKEIKDFKTVKGTTSYKFSEGVNYFDWDVVERTIE